jgi:hypothetical protein
MRKFSSILLFIFLSLLSITGQEVKVTSSFDSTRIFVGDQTIYTITVEKPISYILSIPVFKDSLIKNIEILKGPLTDTSFTKDGRINIKQEYLVTSFDSGFYQVPPVYAEMKDESGIKRFYSDYAQLEVMRVNITPPDTTAKIFDIIRPYKAPLTVGELLPWIMLFFVVCILAWYIVKLIKKMKSKKSGVIPEVKTEPAHIIAFRQLEQLKMEKLWEKGELKAYYTRLTEIARLYLENRFNVFSLELTTPETLAELKKTGFKEDESFRKLRTILTGADLVKFAKYSPEPSENELLFDYTKEFVNATKLEEVAQVNEVINEPKVNKG